MVSKYIKKETTKTGKRKKKETFIHIDLNILLSHMIEHVCRKYR